MKKAAVLFILSFSLALAASLSASSPFKADQVSNAPINPSNLQQEKGGSAITPMVVDPLFDTTLAGTNSTSIFNAAAGYGHIKVFIKNTGSSTITTPWNIPIQKKYILAKV